MVLFMKKKIFFLISGAAFSLLLALPVPVKADSKQTLSAKETLLKQRLNSTTDIFQIGKAATPAANQKTDMKAGQFPWSDCFDKNHSQWDIIDSNGGGAWSMQDTVSDFGLIGMGISGYAARYWGWGYPIDTLPGNDFLVSLPSFNLVAGGTYYVSVTSGKSSGTNIEKYNVYYGKSMEEMILIGTKELSTSLFIFKEDAYMFTPTETGDYHIAIEAASKRDQHKMYIKCAGIDTGLPVRMKIASLNLPYSTASLNANEEAKVVISNIGTVAVDEAEVYIQIGEDTVISKTYSGNLQSGATDTVSFILDFSIIGTYYIKAWTVSGSFVSDTVRGTVAHTTPQTLPWRDDFDVEHTAWNVYDFNGAHGTLGTWSMLEEYEGGNVVAAYIYHAYDTAIPGNDFLVTVAPFSLNANRNYNIVASTFVV
jgi:hypothetical protein